MSDTQLTLPEPLEDGTVLLYNIEDSGQDFPVIGLFLEPGVPLTVGEDIKGDMAARMVARGTLRVVPAEAVTENDETAELASGGLAPPIPPVVMGAAPLFSSTVGDAAPGPPATVVSGPVSAE